jgi:hypothetical protein
MNHKEKANQATINTQRKKRLAVIAAYGGKCKCCGESRFEFMQFDHVNNNGKAHREQVGRGYKFLLWLERNNYPDIIQLLCSNCNFAKAKYGICPHERERIENARHLNSETRQETGETGSAKISTEKFPATNRAAAFCQLV